MMSVFEDSTVNGWLDEPGPIELRHAESKDTRRRDARALSGIIAAAVIGAAILSWTYVIAWWLW